MIGIEESDIMDANILTNLFSSLTAEVQRNTERATNANRADTYLRTITPLETKGDIHCSPWVDSMEDYFLLAKTPEADQATTALITTRGVIQDYVGRIIKANPNTTWAVLKASLIEYYGEDTQPEKFLKQLTSVKQGWSESIEAYYHRVVALGERAFAGAPARDPTIVRQVKYFFINGLRDADVRLAVRRGAPRDVDDAYKKSREELQLRAQDEEDGQDIEPMDIYHMRRGKSRTGPALTSLF